MAKNAIESYLRTSKMAAGGHFVKNFKKLINFCMDLKWPEMPSKVKWISDIQNGRSIWNGQKCDPRWFSDIQNGRQKKFCIDLKCPELRSKVNFGNLKWLIDLKCDRKWILDIQNGHQQPFCQKKIEVAYRSELARNAIESEFQTSKMADVSHFVNNFKKN